MPLNITRLFFGALLILMLAACAPASRSPGRNPASGIPLENCQLSSPELAQRLEAQCGSFPVFEDPSSATGRRIQLRVAILKSISRNPAPDPLFFIPGGPGEAATESYLAVSRAFERIQQKRDIILVDQRGTGGSHALRCPQAEETENAGQGHEEEVQAALKTCLAGLDANPAAYTTENAVGDLDQVRAALGYEKVNLYGGSYGTRVALAYLRRHPEHVRAVILDGVAPPNWTLGPSVAQDAQRALDLLFQRCATDEDCHHAFPDLPAEFHSLQETLRNAPVELNLADPVSGKQAKFTLTYEFFASTIHNMTYSPETAALLPLLIHTAYERNDFSLIAAQGIANNALVTQSISAGMRFSVICAEDVPFYDASSSLDRTTGSAYLGDDILKAFREICTNWPRGQIPADFKDAVQSDAPVLIVSGEADPVTPPANGDLAGQSLPNSLQVVVPGHGHINIFRNCLENIATAFVESGTTRNLDTACVHSMRPMPFFLSFSGPNP